MAELDLEKLINAIEQSLEGKGPGEIDKPLQTKAVEAKFAQAWPEIMKRIQSTAVQRGGGLDVGGYLTSLGKARTGFETEKLGAMADIDKFLASLATQRVGMGTQAGLSYRGQTQAQERFREDLAFREKQLQTQLALLEEQRKAVRKSQRDWWKPFLGTVGGAALGSFLGPLGMTLGAGLGQKLLGSSGGTTGMQGFGGGGYSYNPTMLYPYGGNY